MLVGYENVQELITHPGYKILVGYTNLDECLPCSEMFSHMSKCYPDIYCFGSKIKVYKW